MFKFIRCGEFARFLFDDERTAHKAGIILTAMLEARSPRLSDISQHMPYQDAASYKMIQRFLAQTDPPKKLLRLLDDQAPFVIGDPTEMPRPQARKTPYVGFLKDGRTRGFWMLMLATPYRGRAIPCGFVTYSSKTIAQEATSRNLEHMAAFRIVSELLGDRPLVLDREFSYQRLIENLSAEGINFVIRLNQGSHPPIFRNADGRQIELDIAQDGKPVTHRGLFYRGQVEVNLIGIWRKGLKKPLWVMTTLEPEQGLEIYQQRMKIEQSFRDLKDLLHIDKIMNKTQVMMEKMVAMMLIAYTMAMLVGEAIRDRLFGPPPERSPGVNGAITTKRWHLYSGLFILLKRKRTTRASALRKLVSEVQKAFGNMVMGNVRTPV